jgi:hypothetical protein
MYYTRKKVKKMITTQVKIKGRNKKLFDNNLECAINLAAVYARHGVVPKDYDIERRENGHWWNLNENEDKYDLNPSANDYKAFVRDKGENWILLEFYYRYDNKDKNDNFLFQTKIAELVALMLGEENAEIITK